MSPIYTDLSIEDSGKIVSELEKANVPYELRANGTQILVPSDQMLRLRLSLAQQGLPSGGSIVGYEIFDRSETMGTSSFVMNINMLRALEGELSRTIASLSQVEFARVQLVVPKQELFTRDKLEPTASVVLKLRGSLELSKEEVRAITHLVAASVPGLKPSKVTVVDSTGQMLAGGTGDDSDASASAATSNEYQVAYETHLRNKLESLLEKSLGVGKVKVTVSADIDFDRIVTNSETYDPDGQVVRSVQTGEDKEQSDEKDGRGNTSVANNLPGAQANQSNNGSSRIVDKTDETTNYEISKTVENHVQETGKVNKLSVAVLVDGDYADAKDGKQTYTPRSAADLQEIDSLVKSAIGYDEKRGDKVDVVNMRFTAPVEEASGFSFMDWLKQDLNNIIQTLVFGGVAVLVILMVIRPLIKRFLETPQGMQTPELAGVGAAAMLNAPAMPPTPRLPGTPAPPDAAAAQQQATAQQAQEDAQANSFTRLNELVEKSPDDALSVLRQWSAKRA
jgi:flagellar M-ring protein FliF